MAETESGFAAPWKEWAAQYGTSPRATFRDRIQFEMEARTLYSSLSQKGERLLDVGCGNAATFSSLLALGLRPEAMCGCDALEEFVRLSEEAVPSGRFFRIDITDDNDPAWDRITAFGPTTVIQKRVLCNLSGRPSQRKALTRLTRCLPSHCRLLLIEPIMAGLQRLNALRGAFGLEPLNEPPFNEYLRYDDIRTCLEAGSVVDIETMDYTSTYYIGSRVFQPFLWPDAEPDHDHPINKYFAGLPNREGFGLHWLVKGTKE